jgi:hypothetical protein
MPRPTWHQLWQKRELADQLANAAAAALANYVEDEERHEIEDLEDTPGKRFLFDDPLKVARESTLAGEAPSRSSFGPLRANGDPVVSRSLRACLPGCTCPCVRCAFMRARTHAPAQPRATP